MRWPKAHMVDEDTVTVVGGYVEFHEAVSLARNEFSRNRCYWDCLPLIGWVGNSNKTFRFRHSLPWCGEPPIIGAEDLFAEDEI